MIPVTARLVEAAAAVADGLAVSPTGLDANVALDCWLLLAKTSEAIADAGIWSMVAKP